MLWANLHLLFWLSLVPFATAWMGENHFAPVPTAMYGVVLLCAAIAYTILVRAIIAAEGGSNSKLAAAIGSDRKGQSVARVLRRRDPARVRARRCIADALYVAVALIWLVPDRRIERRLATTTSDARTRIAIRVTMPRRHAYRIHFATSAKLGFLPYISIPTR